MISVPQFFLSFPTRSARPLSPSPASSESIRPLSCWRCGTPGSVGRWQRCAAGTRPTNGRPAGFLFGAPAASGVCRSAHRIAQASERLEARDRHDHDHGAQHGAIEPSGRYPRHHYYRVASAVDASPRIHQLASGRGRRSTCASTAAPVSLPCQLGRAP